MLSRLSTGHRVARARRQVGDATWQASMRSGCALPAISLSLFIACKRLVEEYTRGEGGEREESPQHPCTVSAAIGGFVCVLPFRNHFHPNVRACVLGKRKENREEEQQQRRKEEVGLCVGGAMRDRARGGMAKVQNCSSLLLPSPLHKSSLLLACWLSRRAPRPRPSLDLVAV